MSTLMSVPDFLLPCNRDLELPVSAAESRLPVRHPLPPLSAPGVFLPSELMDSFFPQGRLRAISASVSLRLWIQCSCSAALQLGVIYKLFILITSEEVMNINDYHGKLIRLAYLSKYERCPKGFRKHDIKTKLLFPSLPNRHTKPPTSLKLS